MQYFLDTTGTIPDGVGFSHFSLIHFLWLALFVVLTIMNCIWYLKLQDRGRNIWKKTVAALLVLDEIFKDVMLIVGGRFTADYLPLHLCNTHTH